MKIVFTLFLILCVSNSFALGGKGPLDMNKDGLKNKAPVVLSQIGIDEKLGSSIDLNLNFQNELGEQIILGDYFHNKPVFLMLIYYNCPTLCNTHFNQLIKTLKNFEWAIGEKFNFIAVSIDPSENSQDALKKKNYFLNLYGKPETRDSWHFLTGTEENIKKLASQIGFKYAWDPAQRQWAHSAASYVLTPEGKISYYHYGIDVEPKVFKLSLIEAANNKIGTILDRMVLFCLQYDPNKKTYAFYAFNIMKVGALLMALILALFLFKFWRKENKTQL